MGLNLQAKISLDGADFERGINRAKEAVTGALRNFVIGAIGIGTVEEAFRRTIETANELVNTSKRLGVTVEQVQLLRQAAKDAGKEMDTVSTALEKINLARGKALGGDQKSIAAFSALGVSGADLKSKTAADLFMGEIGKKVKSVSPEQIAGPLREVLGRGAGEGIAILKTDFEELGSKMNLISTETAAKLNELSKDFDLLSGQIIVGLAPAILVMAQACIAFANWVGSKIGGAAAWLGARTAVDLDAQSADINNPANKDHADAIRRAGNHKRGFGKKDLQTGAVAAEVGVEAGFEKWMKNFQASLDEAASKLKNPKPDFNKTQQDAASMRGAHITAASSLVSRAGNFLGTNKGIIHSGGTMVQHAAETAKHTKRTADGMEMLVRFYMKLGMTATEARRDARKDFHPFSQNVPNQ